MRMIVSPFLLVFFQISSAGAAALDAERNSFCTQPNGGEAK